MSQDNILLLFVIFPISLIVGFKTMNWVERRLKFSKPSRWLAVKVQLSTGAGTMAFLFMTGLLMLLMGIR